MTKADKHAAAAKRNAALLPLPEIDFALSVQFIVGWAGEGGEEPRLGWWRTDLASEFGSSPADLPMAAADLTKATTDLAMPAVELTSDLPMPAAELTRTEMPKHPQQKYVVPAKEQS